MRSGETIAATWWVTVSVVKPARFWVHARNAKPTPSTHTTKKSASGLVRARVSSTQNKIVKVRPNKTRSYQVKPIVRLNVHEPRLTVIAPTTPIAYKPASDWKFVAVISTITGRPTAMSSG